ncbi:MAG: hypothetical protein IPM53_33775 [Anaerolineaceae bacterium]|nr:hypothetical protein [Anaerolineaceae bacterium]
MSPSTANQNQLFLMPFNFKPDFVGREAELDLLHQTLQTEQQAAINPAGLSGMGGIGKTQLAVAYAYLAKNEGTYPDGIFWLNAARPLPQEFAALGQKLQGVAVEKETQHQRMLVLRDQLKQFFNLDELYSLLMELGLDKDEFPLTKTPLIEALVQHGSRNNLLDAIHSGVFQAKPSLAERDVAQNEPTAANEAQDEQINTAFAYLRQNNEALIVLDNLADPYQLLEPVVHDLIPAELPCRLLFTTRSRDLGSFTPIPLHILPEQAALKMLLRHPRRQSILQPSHPEHIKAKHICDMLGYLPLALEVAGALLAKRTGLKLTQYAHDLKARGALAVLDDPKLSPDRTAQHSAAVSATLGSMLDTIENDEARLLLKVAGLLPESDYIPLARLGLLTAIPKEPPDLYTPSLGEVALQLADASLIERLENSRIRLHPLVREFAAQLTPKNEREEFLHQCAANLADGYENFEILAAQFNTRGIDEIQEDLLVALELLGVGQAQTPGEQINIPPWRYVRPPDRNKLIPKANVATRPPDLGDITWPRIQRLLRLLLRETHNLHKESATPIDLGQQILKRSLIFEVGPLLASILKGFGENQTTYYLPNWQATNDLDRLEQTVTGHEKEVLAVAITPNGQRALSASTDHTLKLWNLRSGQVEKTLTGHEEGVLAVAITPDGQRAISASGDNTLKLWNLQSGQAEKTLTGHEEGVSAVAITPDGQRALSASFDHTLKLWNLRSGQVEKTLTGHEKGVLAVAITPDGQRAISASGDNTLKLWNLQSGQVEQTLTGHEMWVLAVAITPDGQRALSASFDHTLKLWNLRSGQVEKTFTGHEKGVLAVAITPDGQRAISASGDNALKLWNLQSGQVEQTLTDHEGWVQAVAITPDGQRAISASGDNTLKFWDLGTARLEQTLTGHEKGVLAVAITPDGQRVLSASADDTLKLWNLQSGHLNQTLFGHERAVRAVAITPDGQLAISASEDNTLRFWNLEITRLEQTLTLDRDIVWAVAITPDGQRALFASSDGTLKLWNLQSGRLERTLIGHRNWVTAVAIAADGQRAISASSDGTLKLWNLQSGRLEQTFLGHQKAVCAVAITPDAQRALSASHNEHTLKLWNLQSGHLEQTFLGHQKAVWAVAITPDAQRALSASSDRSLKLWNMQSGEEIASITLDGALHSVAVSSDGITVVTGDGAGSVYCFKIVN